MKDLIIWLFHDIISLSDRQIEKLECQKIKLEERETTKEEIINALEHIELRSREIKRLLEDI